MKCKPILSTFLLVLFLGACRALRPAPTATPHPGYEQWIKPSYAPFG
jgi:hypothetical protein